MFECHFQEPLHGGGENYLLTGLSVSPPDTFICVARFSKGLRGREGVSTREKPMRAQVPVVADPVFS